MHPAQRQRKPLHKGPPPAWLIIMATTRQRLAHTPYLDAWRESLRSATDGRGLKTELARFMAAARDQPVDTWKVNIPKILRGGSIPNGEDVLAISAWLQSRK